MALGEPSWQGSDKLGERPRLLRTRRGDGGGGPGLRALGGGLSAPGEGERLGGRCHLATWQCLKLFLNEMPLVAFLPMRSGGDKAGREGEKNLSLVNEET